MLCCIYLIMPFTKKKDEFYTTFFVIKLREFILKRKGAVLLFKKYTSPICTFFKSVSAHFIFIHKT